jgi:TPR repeat protein
MIKTLFFIIIFIFSYNTKAEIRADIKTLKASASSGSLTAQIKLANAYFYNTYTQLGRALALKWYISAMHLSGRKDILERIEFLISIIYEQHDTAINIKNSLLLHPKTEAPVELIYVAAITYLKGYGIKPDLEKSLYLLKRSANKEYPQAQYFLATTYCDGIYGEKDESMCFYWLIQADRNDHPDASYSLATIYLSSNSIVQKNRTKAIELLSKSARLGNYAAKTLHKALTRIR